MNSVLMLSSFRRTHTDKWTFWRNLISVNVIYLILGNLTNAIKMAMFCIIIKYKTKLDYSNAFQSKLIALLLYCVITFFIITRNFILHAWLFLNKINTKTTSLLLPFWPYFSWSNFLLLWHNVIVFFKHERREIFL